MKNLKLILALLTINLLTINVSAQVLCIYCYDQNDSISHGVNNLIQNGGFEDTTCFDVYGRICPNSTFYSCDITHWICTGGGVNTYAQIIDTAGNSISKVVEGIKAVYFGNAGANTCSSTLNDTTCLTNSNCTVLGVPIGYPFNWDAGYGGNIGVNLQQTVSGLIIGNIYVLEFWVGGEPNFSQFSQRGLFAVDVGFGDTLLRDKPTPPDSGIGTRFIIEFKAIANSHTIKFTNWGHICGNCTELVLDDVRLYTLAELDASVPHCVSIHTGITDPISTTTISLFPNPATNAVTITMNNQSPSEVILYDITGRKLLHESFTGSTTMNIAKLAKGIYLVEISNGKESVMRKMFKV